MNILLAVGLLALGALHGTPGFPVPTLNCRVSPQKPQVDGILHEPCWQEAEAATDFQLLAGRGAASEQTRCMAAYDAENLYVAFVCRESSPSGIRNIETVRDGNVWVDDCIELFLDPRHDGKSYYHVIANLNGTRFDERGRTGAPFPNPRSWDADWKVGTATFPGGWTVEIAIPFRSLGVPVPRAGTIWGFNPTREQSRLGELSSWSAMGRSFHEPWLFGHLLFIPAF